MKSKAILFIHGMFVNHISFQDWKVYFERKGYACIIPDWPHHNKSVPELKKLTNNPLLGRLTFAEVLSSYESIVKSLDEPPILIGHSMGGLIVQMLLNKGLGACGVAIDSAPPKGVQTFKWSFIKSNLPVLNPFKGDKPYNMPFEHFQYTFAHTLPLAEQQAAYDRFIVPESRNVPRTALKTASIDYNKSRSPLLIIAGSEDHIIPASLNKTNFEKYKDCSSVTDFKEFSGRTHLIIGQKGWQEVADFSLNWVERNLDIV